MKADAFLIYGIAMASKTVSMDLMNQIAVIKSDFALKFCIYRTVFLECDGLDQSPCSVGGCVPTFKLCDGLRHCPDGSDEWVCMKIDNATKQLQIR